MNILHLVSGEEPAEVQWGFSKKVVCEPSAHLTNHLQVVVDAWDNKVGEFYPYTGIPHGEDSVKHGLQMTPADTLIDIIAERLQVDIGGIEVWQQVSQWFLTDIACRNEDVPESSLVSKTGCIGDIF